MNMFHRNQKHPPWKRILQFLYDNAIDEVYFEKGKTGFNSNEHPLAKALKINGQELVKNLNVLNNLKLIKTIIDETKNEIFFMTIEEKGFNVALQNEKFEKENKVQINIAIFTILLALTAIWEVIRNIFERAIVDSGMVITILFILALMFLFNIGKIKEF